MKNKIYSFLLLALFVTACGAPANKVESPLAEISGTLEDGESLIEEEKYDEALKIFSDLVKSDPSDPKVRFYLGFCQEKTGDMLNAEQNYKRSIELDGTLIEGKINLGTLYLNENKPLQAIEQFKAAALLDTEDVDIVLNLAYAYEAAKDIENAKKELKKAASMDEENSDPYVALGVIYLTDEDYDKALEYLFKALEINSSDPVAALNIAHIYLIKKDKAKAIKYLLSVGDMDADGEMYAQAAITLGKIKETDSAVDLYKKAINSNPPYIKANILLGNILARDKNFKEAAVYFEEYLKISPDSPDAANAKKALEACKAQLK
ncbi:MAG: tetratricopeptide repeat protein [Deltaproteobacteria bacterium]|nr:tetratricopeptide repeat protein [Deltaproteobacteria bacterium]